MYRFECKYYGSMRGCSYGDRCQFSHSRPNSIPYCQYLLHGVECPKGNYCEDRHFEFNKPINNKRKRKRKRKKKKTKNESIENEAKWEENQLYDNNADIIPLLNKYDIYLGYGGNQDIVYRVQYTTKTKHKLNEKYCYHAKNIFTFLKRQYQYDEICRIGVWSDKMTQKCKTQNNWKQYIKSLDKNNKLTEDETNSVIKLTRNIINHYNGFWKDRKYSPPIFFNIMTKQQLKLLVYGFLNELQLIIDAIIPIEIIKVCILFFITTSSYNYRKHLKFYHNHYCTLSDTMINCIDKNSDTMKHKRYSYLIHQNPWKTKTGQHWLQLKYIDNGVIINTKYNEIGDIQKVEKQVPRFSIGLIKNTPNIYISSNRWFNWLFNDNDIDIKYEWRWNERISGRWWNDERKYDWDMNEISIGSLIEFKYDSYNGKVVVSQQDINGKRKVSGYRVKKNISYYLVIAFRNHSKIKFEIIYYK